MADIMTPQKQQQSALRLNSGWVAVVVTIVFQTGIIFYNYGQLVQKIEDMGSRLEKVEGKIDLMRGK